jgi:hypothetical protein
VLFVYIKQSPTHSPVRTLYLVNNGILQMEGNLPLINVRDDFKRRFYTIILDLARLNSGKVVFA